MTTPRRAHGGTKQVHWDSTDEWLAVNRAQRCAYSIPFGGHDYTVLPGVFAPDLFEDTYFFLEALRVAPGEALLEIGAGAGLIAVSAARAGARRVVATDINPRAVRNVEENAALHGVSDRVQAVHGDLYAPLDAGERFDVIFWNAPFIGHGADGGALSAPRDDLDRSVFDPGHAGLARYIAGGSARLAPGGRLMLGYSSSSGEMAVVESLAAEAGLSVELVDRRIAEDDFAVELLHLRRADG